MPYRNLFDEVAAIGQKFLESTDREHKVLMDYAWQLASICDLLKHTHLIVIKKLEAINEAQTIEDAIAITQDLSGQSLSDIFHANGLCDVFRGYGRSLRQITERYRFTADRAETELITAHEKYQWEMFCDSLEENERDVAQLYIDQIQTLQDLVYGSSGQDLEQIQDQARKTKDLLTDQIASFDALAANFRSRIKV